MKEHLISEAALNGMSREINSLTDQVRLLEPALKCAGLLKRLAVGEPPNWLDIVDALRALDEIRGWR